MGRSAGTPLEPEDPPAIGPYELIRRLGSGGMGVVYLAKAPDGSKVAVKAIRRDFTADPVYRARFHEEVSNARKVASFCTARVLDHGEDRGRLYLVTEYIDGISLEDHLIEHGALSPSVLHAAAVGVAAALTAIHAAGLVHRDLKPANVMLTLAGPRVIDFGLARSTHVHSRHTNAGMVMGTPGWIAPEQVFEGQTSPAGDVFAWGSLIAYAGLGGHPFGEGDAYVMAARARQAPPDLRGLPEPLDRLVAAAIHPDPARRPAARQLLLELVGAADEPAAQLAATKHLTNAWNPSEFGPLMPPPPDVAHAGAHPAAHLPPQPPPAERTGPTPGTSRAPQPPGDRGPVPGPAPHPGAAPHVAPQGAPGPSHGPQPGPAHAPAPQPGPGTPQPGLGTPQPGPQGGPGGPQGGPAAPQGGTGAPQAGPGGPQPGPGAPQGGPATPPPGPNTPQGAPGAPQPAPVAPQGGPATPPPGPNTPQGGLGAPQGGPGSPQGGPGAQQGGPGAPQGGQAGPGAPQPGPNVPQAASAHAPQQVVPGGAPQGGAPQGAPQGGAPQGAPQGGAPQGAPQGGAPQPPPAERTGPRPGGAHPQPPSPAERTGPRPGSSHQPPPAERTGPRPGSSRPPQQPPPAERTGPRPGGAHPQPPSPAERTGPLPRVSHPPQQPPLEWTGPMPQVPVPPRQGRPMPQRPGRGPRQLYGNPKRGVATGCLAAVAIVAVLMVVVISGLSWFFRSPAVGEDGPVQDGKLRFAVTGVNCADTGKAAAKRTCEVGIQVRNVGQEARVLYPGQQKLIDEDKALHGGTKLLDEDGKEITPVRIEAGRTFKGALVFELPNDLDPLGLEVHDSGLSRGARLNLD
ncbi:protein kinase [Nonomuraea sp. N2-4H]|uniref:serine/threonine-protein kinase n=1 Tax=Nonomuraea sp. N2-4H TaxID=3128898 RepID=UPI003255A7AD